MAGREGTASIVAVLDATPLGNACDVREGAVRLLLVDATSDFQSFTRVKAATGGSHGFVFGDVPATANRQLGDSTAA